MKKILLITLLLAAAIQGTYAVRASGGWHTATQSDGTEIEVMLCGDEWFNYFVTRDLVPLVMVDNGDLCYADAYGFGMKSSGVIAHEAANRSADELCHVSSLKAVEAVEPYAAAARATAARQRAIQQPSNLRGKYRGLIILVEFPDLTFKSATPKEDYLAMFNEVGYHGTERAMGSIHDYFADQSHGLFDVTFDVVGPVQVSDSCHQYQTSALVRDNFAPEAIKAAAKFVNFADYDWDGDNEVENVIMIYAGYGRNEYHESKEYTKKAKESIWPMEWELSPILTFDGVKVNTFAVSNELSVATDELAGFGTLCHEFSHCLGLPDLYDTYSSPSDSDGGLMDSWDLMDGGNYNDDGWCPPNYSAYERFYCGWLTPTELSEDATITGMPALCDADMAYKIVNETPYVNVDEYYLLENRQQRGWDRSVPSHGLVIWHIDYNAALWRNNRPNDDINHLRCMPICADNDPLAHYETRRRLMKGIPYPYTDSNGNVNNHLTDTSTPAAKVFNQNKAGSNLMGKPIKEISESENGYISFRFYSSNTAGITAPVNTPQGGKTPTYDLQGRRQSSASQSNRPGIYVEKGRKILRK